VITRSTCKFEDSFDKKTIAFYEEQLKIADTDEEFLEVNRDAFNNMEEELEESVPGRVRVEELPNEDGTLPVIDDVDDNDGEANYWNPPMDTQEDVSIIPMYNDWMKDMDDAEDVTDNESISEKSNMCMCIHRQMSADIVCRHCLQ